MVIEDRSEFRPGQRVRVREEGGDPDSQPDERFLGKEATIAGRAPSCAYWVAFVDSGEAEAIGIDWLESVE